MTELQELVLEQLKKGKAKAIPGKLLATRLNLQNTRQIRLSIIELIRQGYPICGTAKPPYGYYLAENKAECQECLDQLMSYLKNMAIHHKHLLRASKSLMNPHQITMRL